MNKIFAIIPVVTLLVCSCTPSVYNVYAQMRRPSNSGLDIVGKSLSVISLEPQDKSDTSFCRTMAEAIASNLEKEYFDGEQSIAVYRAPRDPMGKYVSKDSLVSMVMKTGSDVVILQDVPNVIMDGNNRLSCLVQVYVYDSMNKANDKVFLIKDSEAIPEKGMASLASKFGEEVARQLYPNWKEERIDYYYYLSWGNDWDYASYYAEDMQWKKAMDIWMKQSVKGSSSRRAAACYNVAVSCYMLGDMELARKWLDESEKLGHLDLASRLRKKIDRRLRN